jgi:hypothetical protein
MKVAEREGILLASQRIDDVAITPACLDECPHLCPLTARECGFPALRLSL